MRGSLNHLTAQRLLLRSYSHAASGRALSRHQHHTEHTVQGLQLSQSQVAHGLSLVELEGTEEASAPGQQRAGLLMASAGDSTAGAGPPIMEQSMQRGSLRGVPTLGLVAALADQGASASGDPSVNNDISQATSPACGTNHSSSSSSSDCCCSRNTSRSPGESPSPLVLVVLSMGGLAPTAPAGSSSSLLGSSSNSSSNSSNNSSSSSARLAVQPPLPQHSLPIQAGTAEQVAAVGVPDRCIVAGSALFSSCSVEISAAQVSHSLDCQ